MDPTDPFVMLDTIETNTSTFATNFLNDYHQTMALDGITFDTHIDTSMLIDTGSGGGDAPHSDSESLRNTCQQLANLMGKIGYQVGSMAINNRARPPLNPMSSEELGMKMEYRVGQNAGFAVSMLATMPPFGGPITQVVKFAGDFFQTKQDFDQWSEHPIKAGFSAGFFTNSTLLFIDYWMTGRGMSPILTRTTALTLERSLILGAVITTADIVVPPLIEYIGRNAEIPAAHSPQQLNDLWQNVYGPQLKELSDRFNLLKCSEVLDDR